MLISEIILLTLICLFTSDGTSQLPAYQYNTKIEYQSNLLIENENAINEVISAQVDFKFTAQLYFNDSNSFYLDNFEFDIDSTININGTYEDNFNDYKYIEIAINETNFDDYFTFWLDFQIITGNKYIISLDTVEGNVYQNTHTIYMGTMPNDKKIEYKIIGTDTLYPQIQQYINMVAGNNSYYQGTLDGYNNGYTNGYQDGNEVGYQNGYANGYTEGATTDETAVAIFSGIINIALVPINFFLACLNFEVFGINIGAFVSALLTVAIIVIIVRIIVSGGNKNG